MSSSLVRFPTPPTTTAPPEPQVAKLLRAVARVMDIGKPEFIANATDYLNSCADLAVTIEPAIH